MIYNFYTNMTSGPIVNYFNQFLPGVRLVDYEVRDIPHNTIYGDKAKIFTLGYEGDTFKLLISQDDILCITTDNGGPSPVLRLNRFLMSHLGGSSENKKELIQLKSCLTILIRDTKINQILN